MIKRILISTVIFGLLLLSFLPLGCTEKTSDSGSSESGNRAASLLVDLANAMCSTNSYRISGSIARDNIAAGAPDENKHLTFDFQAEVQIADSKIRKHEIDSGWNPDKPDLQIQYYLIGDQFYQLLAGDQWKRNPGYAYVMMMNAFPDLIDKDQMALMAKMAQSLQIVEEDDEEVEISFQLNDDYYNALDDSAKQSLAELEQQLPGYDVQSLGEDMMGFQAAIHIWLAKDSNLIDHITMDITETTTRGQVIGTTDMRLDEYDEGIQVVLPEEAKNAPSI